MDSFTYPNLNGDSYRQLTPADRPPVPDNHLQFITVSKVDSVVLGGSNLTDLWQGGTLWYYENTRTDFAREQCHASTKTVSGVTDGAFLNANKLAVGEESGDLHILEVIDNSDPSDESIKIPEIRVLESTCQHDDSLTTLSVFSESEHIVTGGMDCCIKVWDPARMIAIHSFNYAHTHLVTGVDANPKDESVFASSSLDDEALLWDVRQPKPANSILKKDGIGITAVAWKKDGENILAVGASDGSITIVDVRNSSASKESVVFKRAVHRMVFNPKHNSTEQLAACCDDCIVKVFDTSKEFETIYEYHESYRDFVRGLAWSDVFLLTCCWDGSVDLHVI